MKMGHISRDQVSAQDLGDAQWELYSVRELEMLANLCCRYAEEGREEDTNRNRTFIRTYSIEVPEGFQRSCPKNGGPLSVFPLESGTPPPVETDLLSLI